MVFVQYTIPKIALIDIVYFRVKFNGDMCNMM